MDRILAVVDEDPILASDVDRVIGLGLVEPQPEEADELFRRRVLELLIDERLRFHEIDRFGFARIPVDEVEAQFEQMETSLGGPEALAVRLEEVGLEAQGLRQLLARQLMVLIYVEERLGPRVFVSLDDIRQYYDGVLKPEMRSRGQTVPPVSELREQIREVVKEIRLNEEIDRWTAELRLEADIEDYFEREAT